MKTPVFGRLFMCIAFVLLALVLLSGGKAFAAEPTSFTCYYENAVCVSEEYEPSTSELEEIGESIGENEVENSGMETSVEVAEGADEALPIVVHWPNTTSPSSTSGPRARPTDSSNKRRARRTRRRKNHGHKRDRTYDISKGREN